MAASDATAIPVKNQAYRVTFPIWDADGDLVTGATGLDSEISKDAGTFADCTNEATEIATSSGIYYLDLTSTEMNADTVAIIVKTSSSGAKTTPIILYPQEAGDINVDVTYWNGTAVATPDTAGYPKVTIKSGTGTGEVSLTSGIASVNTTQISGDSVAADNLEAACDGTTYNIGGGAVVAASVTGAVGSVTGAVGSVTGAVGSVTGDVGGNVTGSVGSVATGGIAAASFAANAIDAAALATDAVTEIQSGLATAANLATVAGYLDTEIAAILADTNELQTDWADGGRLDLILDARASQASVDTVDDLLDTEVAAIKTVVDSILVDTAEIGAAGAGLTALATQASVNTIDDFLDTEVAAILAAVDTEVAAIKTKTDQLTFSTANRVDSQLFGAEANTLTASALAADAATEITTAVWAKAMTELASVPGVTGTVLEALEWCFLLARNKVTQTSTTQTLRNDADSGSIGTSTVSDDGTTATRGEWA